MKNVFLLFFAVCISFSACKKDESIVDPQNSTSEYLPMQVGNYWVYKVTDIDPNGNILASFETDSIVILKDTLIGSKTFYRFDNYSIQSNKAEFVSTSFLRDSSKYLIDVLGRRLFSELNFTDTLIRKTELSKNDTVYNISFKMEAVSTPLTVDAGEFGNLLNFKGTVNCSPEFTKIPNPRYTNNCYAKGVGKVYFTAIWVGAGGEHICSLVRYKVQ